MRELENVVHRATVMAKGVAILPSDLPLEISGVASDALPVPPPVPLAVAAESGPAGAAAPEGSPEQELARLASALFRWARREPKLKVIPTVERELVVQALQETRGNQVQAAKFLGITRATLRKRMERFGIKTELNVQ